MIMLSHQSPLFPSNDGVSPSPLSLNMLASPRSDPSVLCKYKSGKCSNRRATKRNGQLHTLCHFHRVRQNEHQRKSDRKHRMVSVAKRAKLGSLGALLVTERRIGRRSSTSSLSSELASESESAPASPMDVGQPIGLAGLRLHGSIGDGHERYGLHPHAIPGSSKSPFGSALHIRTATSSEDGSPGSSQASPIHWRRSMTRMASQGELPGIPPRPMTPDSNAPSVGTPTGRLPPISYLTQQVPGKLDAYRSPNASSMLAFPPSSFLHGQANHQHQAGKSA